MEDVGSVPHLVRRKAIYYCRMRCPQHLLRDEMPLEKSISLNTSDRRLALERLPAARLQIMEFFQGETPVQSRHIPSDTITIRPRARRPDHPDLPFLTSGEAGELAKKYFASSLYDLDVAQGDVRSLNAAQKLDWKRELEHLLGKLEHPLPDDDDPIIALEVEALRNAGRRSPLNSEPSRLLRSYLERAQRQLWQIELARMGGDFQDRISDSFFLEKTTGAPSSIVLSYSSVSIGDAVAEFRIEEVDSDKEMTPKTKAKKLAALALIERYYGSDRAIETVSGADCRSYRNLLAKLPANLNKRYPKEMSLVHIAERSIGKYEPMSRQTQINYLRLLKNLLEFTHSQGRIKNMPFPSNLHVKGKGKAKERARNSYSDVQLKKIFSAPVFTGCVDDERGFAKPLPGHIIRRSRFWLPLIALFTGSRMEEILQLTKWHIQTAPANLPCFLIGENMRVKTAASYRVVPIHDELLKIGLMAHVLNLKSDDDLLFPDVPLGSDDFRSTIFSKRYSTFWKSLRANEPGRSVTFHSFRHNFRDALRLPDIENSLIRELQGWSRGSEVSESYGDGARAVVLRPILNKVIYDVDLSHLYSG